MGLGLISVGDGVVAVGAGVAVAMLDDHALGLLEADGVIGLPGMAGKWGVENDPCR